MGRYDGINCPICGKTFTDKDNIVVCPICGGPHHRACYEEQGKCAYIEKHATGEEWRRPPEKIIDGDAYARCSRCGTVNPAEGIFCEVCGNPLNRASEVKPNTGGAIYGADGKVNPPFVMPYNPYTTPYGGLNPDESIDGISVKDIAMFVGAGSYYYLPKFKEMFVTKKNISWNWAAFFGNALYFCGRGMYMLGALLAAVFIIKQLPSFIATFNYFSANMEVFLNNPTAMLSMDLPPASIYWVNISNILNSVYWTSCFAFGVFGNKLYQKHVFSSIKLLKEKLGDTEEYRASLTKKGGLRTGIVVGLVIAFLLLSFAVSIGMVIYLQKFPAAGFLS